MISYIIVFVSGVIIGILMLGAAASNKYEDFTKAIISASKGDISEAEEVVKNYQL